MSSTSINWDAVRNFRAVIVRDEPPAFQILKSPAEGAKILAVASWSWGPSHSRSYTFWFHADQKTNLAMLWLEIEDEEADLAYQVVAYGGPCAGVPDRHSAWILLESFLISQKSVFSEPAHDFHPGCGILDEDAMEQIYGLVWPETAGKQEFPDQAS